jgi:signal transduction histidine kinase
MNDSDVSGESRPSGPPEGGHRVLVENFPNGILVLFDADLRYRIVGPETLPFSGREAEEMVGRTLSELFPSATADRLEPELRDTLAGTPRSFDVEYESEVHHVETRPVTIDGTPYGVLTTQAVTEDRRLSRELERQNERLDQFASMVSHDLQNPLSIATGRLDLYRETGEESHLADVETALSRMQELLRDLSALARDDARATERKPVSLASLATEAWAAIDSRSATLATDDCTVVGDAGQLQALLENLFRNAVGHGGADVTVRVGPLEDGFYVEDTGEGIPPERRERVFEHGFTTGYGGSGVGLTIVDRIANTHDFEVSLAESDEGGARFEFRER